LLLLFRKSISIWKKLQTIPRFFRLSYCAPHFSFSLILFIWRRIT
jgi:hypothetical protein